MKSTFRIVAGLAAVAAIAIAVPALAGSGAEDAASPKKVAKKALKKARKALKKANNVSKQAGPQGPQGPQGPAGDAATTYWAVVGSDGTLVRGSAGAVSEPLFKPGTDGSYQVAFGENVTGCALLATLGRTDSANLDPDSGEIGTAYRSGSPDAVYVKTRNSSGTAADRSFHLALAC